MSFCKEKDKMKIKFDKDKLKDYASTLAFAAVPVVIAYQAEIGRYVPVEYALLFTIGMAILSQLMADKRVKAAVVESSAKLDEGQAEVQKYLDMIAELNQKIDEKQAEIARVAGLKELDAA